MISKTYNEIEKDVFDLYQQQEYEIAIDILKQSIVSFPKNKEETILSLSYCYKALDDYQACTDLFIEALDDGFYFQVNDDFWQELTETKNYKFLLDKTMKMKEEHQRKSVMMYEVFTPNKYVSTKEYPLLFILHGNDENLKIAKEGWAYKTALERDFIVVYVQSSQVRTSNSFVWTNSFATTREDLLACFNKIKLEYSIDEDKVIIAGFSAGAKAAMSIAMNNTFKIKGFISLCGLMFDDLTDENLQDAKKKGLKAVLADGEKSSYKDFPKILTIFKKNDFPFKSISYKEMGHWYPDEQEMECFNIDSIKYLLG